MAALASTVEGAIISSPSSTTLLIAVTECRGNFFTARRYAKRGICRRRVSAGFVLTRASHSPSAIAELLVNFGGPIHISGMAEARALRFCTKEDYIKSCQRDDISLLKGVWFCSHDPFLYAQLWSWKKYSTALGELRLTMSSTTDY